MSGKLGDEFTVVLGVTNVQATKGWGKGPKEFQGSAMGMYQSQFDEFWGPSEVFNEGMMCAKK